METHIIKVAKIQDLDTLTLDFCDTFSIEVTGLYPIIKVLPNLADDSTIIKSLLFKNGFTPVDWGTGNWEKGLRFTYLKFTKGNCECKTFKKYYFNQKLPDNTFDLRVSERIICNSENFMDD